MPKVLTSKAAEREGRAAKKLVNLEDKRSKRTEEALCGSELLKRMFVADGWAWSDAPSGST